jgi:signal peptidase
MPSRRIREEKEKMMEKLKKVWNVISTVLVVIVVAIAVFLVGSRIAGFRVFTVLTPSMEPAYKVGSLIYVKKTAPDKIKVGDPITFVLNEDLVVATHRVVRIDAENKHFYTKGDANNVEDQDPVHFNNLIGRPVFSIPYLGYVSNWIQHSPGIYITVAAGVLLLVAVFLPDIIKGIRRGDQNERKEVTDSGKSAQEEELEKMRKELEEAKAQLAAAKQAQEENARDLTEEDKKADDT